MELDFKVFKKLLETIVKQQEEIARLNDIIGKDVQTGLYNRHYCTKIKDNLFFDASVLMIDIDDFKNINDNYGHPFGDKMIQMVASIIAKNSRATDIPIRYGGEEFALILNGCSLENAYNVANKVRQEIEKSYLIFNGIKVSVTVSIGISLKTREDNLETTIEEADKALYESKKNGKNVVTLFQKDILKKTIKN